jgi:hypothetical protein
MIAIFNKDFVMQQGESHAFWRNRVEDAIEDHVKLLWTAT